MWKDSWPNRSKPSWAEFSPPSSFFGCSIYSLVFNRASACSAEHPISISPSLNSLTVSPSTSSSPKLVLITTLNLRARALATKTVNMAWRRPPAGVEIAGTVNDHGRETHNERRRRQRLSRFLLLSILLVRLHRQLELSLLPLLRPPRSNPWTH